MKITPTDISTLMNHYIMTKNPTLGIFSSDASSANKLHKLGLIVDKDPGEMNRPLTDKGLTLAQLIVDYANEV
jgi:hypothetical protein